VENSDRSGSKLHKMKGDRMNVRHIATVILVALVTLVPGVTAPALAAGGEKITVHNPAIAGRLAERVPLTPRLDTVRGKTIYMVDNQWGGPDGAYQLFEEVKAWFEENMPDVTIVLRRTKDNMFGDDPELWKEISEQGDAAIVGTGQ